MGEVGTEVLGIGLGVGLAVLLIVGGTGLVLFAGYAIVVHPKRNKSIALDIQTRNANPQTDKGAAMEMKSFGRDTSVETEPDPEDKKTYLVEFKPSSVH